MNVIEASYNLGKTVRKLDEGNKLIELYNSLKENTSKDAWHGLNTLGPVLPNYYRYPIAKSIVESISINGPIPIGLEKEVNELLGSKELEEYCRVSVDLGGVIEKFAISMFSPQPITSLGSKKMSYKFIRAVEDLNEACQKTRVFRNLLRYMNPETKELPGIVSIYEAKKTSNYYPFHPLNRKLMRDLASNETDIKLLILIEQFSGLLSVIKQTVYETHLDLILELEDNSIKRMLKRDVNRIIPFIIDVNQVSTDIMSWTGNLFKLEQGTDKEYGIVIKRKLQWNSVGEKTLLSGYFYPSNDSLSN